MIQLDNPQSVREQLDAGLAGFNCRTDMRAHILAKEAKRTTRRRAAFVVPAIAAAAALIIAVLGITGIVRRPLDDDDFYVIEAGNGTIVRSKPVIDQDFVLTVEDDHAILIHNGKLYRMTRMLDNLAVQGPAVGEVTNYSENPYDHIPDDSESISNAVLKGDAIYSVNGLAVTTALLAEVDGQLALFQRSGEHGFGLDGDSLQDTCAVQGQIASISLDGVGTLEGEQAEQAIAVLMEKARLENAEALPGEQMLVITLKNGVQLELSLSGDQLIGCGVWDCTEFLDIFRALVAEHTPNQVV